VHAPRVRVAPSDFVRAPAHLRIAFLAAHGAKKLVGVLGLAAPLVLGRVEVLGRDAFGAQLSTLGVFIKALLLAIEQLTLKAAEVDDLIGVGISVGRRIDGLWGSLWDSSSLGRRRLCLRRGLLQYGVTLFLRWAATRGRKPLNL